MQAFFVKHGTLKTVFASRNDTMPIRFISLTTLALIFSHEACAAALLRSFLVKRAFASSAACLYQPSQMVMLSSGRKRPISVNCFQRNGKPISWSFALYDDCPGSWNIRTIFDGDIADYSTRNALTASQYLKDRQGDYLDDVDALVPLSSSTNLLLGTSCYKEACVVLDTLTNQRLRFAEWETHHRLYSLEHTQEEWSLLTLEKSTQEKGNSVSNAEYLRLLVCPLDRSGGFKETVLEESQEQPVRAKCFEPSNPHVVIVRDQGTNTYSGIGVTLFEDEYWVHFERGTCVPLAKPRSSLLKECIYEQLANCRWHDHDQENKQKYDKFVQSACLLMLRADQPQSQLWGGGILFAANQAGFYSWLQ